VQETYVKALKGFRWFQPGTNFRAWIYPILRNTATPRNQAKWRSA
jgi:RNA polymerase sigma-70 factor (ECF subfamily)